MPSFSAIVEHVRWRATGRVPNSHRGPLPWVPHRPTTNPILPVNDMPAAIAFYEALGFEVNAYDDGYAWIRQCGWEWLHLRLVPDLDPAANEASAYLHVADVETWHRVFTGSSVAAAVGDQVDQPWGMREFELIDPAGNLVRVGQHR